MGVNITKSEHEAPPHSAGGASWTAPTLRFGRDLLIQALGAVGWAVCLVVLPFEILVLGAVAWGPLLIWRESKRTKKYGFLPGAIVRIAVVAVVVVVAINQPRNYDRHLDSTYVTSDRLELTVSEVMAICAAANPRTRHIDWHAVDEIDLKKTIKLPAHSLTLRELASELHMQADLDYRHSACGNGTTMISGVPLGQVAFYSRRKTN